MALNAVMLNASTRKPVPLPDEKRFIEVENVETAMQGMSNSTTVDAAATPLKATGSVYVTSHRVVFVSSAPPSSLAEASSSQLVTLSCNLSHFQDGRLVQPWLAGTAARVFNAPAPEADHCLASSANYYEAVVLPQTGGKLDRPHSIKIHFRNGRAYEFYQALEEAKTRYEEVHGRGRPVEEPLRMSPRTSLPHTDG